MKQRPNKYRGIEFQNDVERNKNSDEEIELTTKTSNAIKTTEIELQEGDTLQALSIRYHCPIAELKRLNNLHKENEIFARRTIKVPYRHFSMPTVHNSGDSSPNANLSKNSIDASILKQKLSFVNDISVKNGSIVHDLLDLESVTQTENNFNQIIFNTTISQKEDFNDLDDEFTDEEIQLLPNNQIIEDTSSAFSCSGADWGLSWLVLLGIILIVAFAGPLIYIFYITEHPEKYHHHNS